MPIEIPYFVEGKVVELMSSGELVLVKTSTGNIYHLYPETPGIEFEYLMVGQKIRLEVTSMLTRVLSAKIM